jgi:hypothetical protein
MQKKAGCIAMVGSWLAVVSLFATLQIGFECWPSDVIVKRWGFPERATKFSCVLGALVGITLVFAAVGILRGRRYRNRGIAILPRILPLPSPLGLAELPLKEVDVARAFYERFRWLYEGIRGILIDLAEERIMSGVSKRHHLNGLETFQAAAVSRCEELTHFVKLLGGQWEEYSDFFHAVTENLRLVGYPLGRWFGSPSCLMREAAGNAYVLRRRLWVGYNLLANRLKELSVGASAPRQRA